MDTAYWIAGAADLCRDLNVHNTGGIPRLLTGQLLNCRPIQVFVEEHIASHEQEGGQTTQCSPVCLLEFALANDTVYTKPTADLTSALARYVKPPTMDVNEHIIAHLAKEEDLIRRRNVRISPSVLRDAMFGKVDENETHVCGSVEDTVARPLDSLRLNEPDLIDHLNKLLLFVGGPNWTLQGLINAIRAYERSMHSLPMSSSTVHCTALIRNYKAKTEALSARTSARSYNLYDPNAYTGSKIPQIVTEVPPPKRPRSDNASMNEKNATLIQSIAKMSSAAESSVAKIVCCGHAEKHV